MEFPPQFSKFQVFKFSLTIFKMESQFSNYQILSQKEDFPVFQILKILISNFSSRIGAPNQFTLTSHSSKLPFSSASTIPDLGEDSRQFMKETVTALDPFSLERKKITLLDKSKGLSPFSGMTKERLSKFVKLCKNNYLRNHPSQITISSPDFI